MSLIDDVTSIVLFLLNQKAGISQVRLQVLDLLLLELAGRLKLHIFFVQIVDLTAHLVIRVQSATLNLLLLLDVVEKLILFFVIKF